ncbi:MAG: hypothetical protein QM658_14225 [Gordonia sp. (in: high G+C Gram-positive bacteria)]
MKDPRLYGKFTLDFPDSHKILPLSDAAFRCLVEATLWSRKHMTDGVLAKRLATAKWSLDVLHELASNDPENPSLIEVEEGWLIHDFADHQDTKAEIEARSARSKAAGRKGGQARAKRAAKRTASATVSGIQAETETETETREKTSSSLSRTRLVEEPHDAQAREMVPIPDDWAPNDLQRAKYPRPDLDELAEAFRDHAISVGRTCNGRAGWDAAFGSWIRKSPPPGGPQHADPNRSGWDALRPTTTRQLGDSDG